MTEECADWLHELDAACEASSNVEIAHRLGVSAGAVSAVRRGIYGASTENMRRRVEGVLMGRTVACPVIGEIRRDACLRNQHVKAQSLNPFRARLAEACPRCVHRRQS